MSARISANENAAIATLRSIASAKSQLESSCAIDTDADGGGEYGYFGELAGTAFLRIYDPVADAPAIGPDRLEPAILPTAFGDIFADARSRLEVIVTFMALLELIKARAVRAQQAKSFSELWIFPGDSRETTETTPEVREETR